MLVARRSAAGPAVIRWESTAGARCRMLGPDTLPGRWQVLAADVAATGEETAWMSPRAAAEVAAYRGGWLGQAWPRARSAFNAQASIPFVTGWWVGGLMLVGMALLKTGVLTAERSNACYRRLLAAGLLASLLLIAGGVAFNLHHRWSAERSMLLGELFNQAGSLGLAAAWLAVTMFAVRRGRLPRTRRALAAVGRTALSNYLGQTLVCTTLFYGHGFGLFGRLELAELFLVVAGIWVGQVAVSVLWLRRFQYGPAEWLWGARSPTGTRRPSGGRRRPTAARTRELTARARVNAGHGRSALPYRRLPAEILPPSRNPSPLCGRAGTKQCTGTPQPGNKR
jgi:uncharacterized protein